MLGEHTDFVLRDRLSLSDQALDRLEGRRGRVARTNRYNPEPAMIRDQETLDRILDDVIDGMRQLGLFGLTIPGEYGGLDVTMEEEVSIAFEFGRTSLAFRSYVGTNNGIGTLGISLDGTKGQKATYLPRLASGELTGSFCLTEPDAGSDAGSLRTTAVMDGNQYVINGMKRYITNAAHAGIFTVIARTNPAIEGAGGISAFIVERDTPGISLDRLDRKMGQRGAHTCDVVFEDVRVPTEQLIGTREGVDFGTAMRVLDKGRLHIAALSVGAAERMLSDALQYALDRKQFGKAIAEFQLVQAMLADGKAEIYAARCLVLDAARKRDRGVAIPTEASCSKMFATEMYGRVADRCVQIHGGAGYVSDYAIERATATAASIAGQV